MAKIRHVLLGLSRKIIPLFPYYLTYVKRSLTFLKFFIKNYNQYYYKENYVWNYIRIRLDQAG